MASDFDNKIIKEKERDGFLNLKYYYVYMMEMR